MMSLIIFYLLVINVSFIYCADYCAVFTPSSAAGTNGYIKLHIQDDGSFASYETFVDMANTNTSFGSPLYCDINKGVTYHIHTSWTNANASASGSACGTAASGTLNHYDPYLACGPNSQNANTLCPKTNRTATSTPAYSYNCSSSIFKAGHYDFCEVGDLSGKFGKLFPVPGSRLFVPAKVTDFKGPLNSKYNRETVISTKWLSIVLHCAGFPNRTPTISPSILPTIEPTKTPTISPSFSPTVIPIMTSIPSTERTKCPSTIYPTTVPSLSPTKVPSPTNIPSTEPTNIPSIYPSGMPMNPSVVVTNSPKTSPSLSPTSKPTVLTVLTYSDTLLLLLDGGCVSLISYNSSLVITTSVSLTMQIPSSCVTYLGCQTAATTATVVTNHQLQATFSMASIVTKISYPITNSSINATSLYQNLNKKLSTAVKGVSFTALIRSQAQLLQAPSLLTANAVSVTYSTYTLIQMVPTSSPVSSRPVFSPTSGSIPSSTNAPFVVNNGGGADNNSTYVILFAVFAALSFILIVIVVVLLYRYYNPVDEKSIYKELDEEHDVKQSDTLPETHEMFPTKRVRREESPQSSLSMRFNSASSREFNYDGYDRNKEDEKLTSVMPSSRESSPSRSDLLGSRKLDDNSNNTLVGSSIKMGESKRAIGYQML